MTDESVEAQGPAGDDRRQSDRRQDRERRADEHRTPDRREIDRRQGDRSTYEASAGIRLGSESKSEMSRAFSCSHRPLAV